MTEGSSRRPRGFGFVTFENPESVAAITRTRYHPIEGRLVEVKAAVPRDVMQQMSPDASSADGVDAMSGGVYYAHSAPGSPIATAPSAPEWYGYAGGFTPGYNGGTMMNGVMSDVATGVPVYSGFSPGYPPQMMVPMGPQTAASMGAKPPLSRMMAGMPPMAPGAVQQQMMLPAAQFGYANAATMPVAPNMTYVAMPAPMPYSAVHSQAVAAGASAQGMHPGVWHQQVAAPAPYLSNYGGSASEA